MSLVALRCPYCNGNIQLEDSKEFGFCMHCGTKIMVPEVISRNVKIDYSDRIANLVELGKNSVRGGSPFELRDISHKILEFDSGNWYGWYLEGVAAAKMGDCAGMYEAWEKAVETISVESYHGIRDEMITFAAGASIGFDASKKTACIPREFLSAIDSIEPRKEGRFISEVVRTMRRASQLFNGDTSVGAISNACYLLIAELHVCSDLRDYRDRYEDVVLLNNTIVNTAGSFGEDIHGYRRKVFNSVIVPFKILDDCLRDSRYSTERFDEAAKYWLHRRRDRYLLFIDDAIRLSISLEDAGSFEAASIKKQIRRNMESLISRYINHN